MTGWLCVLTREPDRISKRSVRGHPGRRWRSRSWQIRFFQWLQLRLKKPVKRCARRCSRVLRTSPGTTDHARRGLRIRIGISETDLVRLLRDLLLRDVRRTTRERRRRADATSGQGRVRLRARKGSTPKVRSGHLCVTEIVRLARAVTTIDPGVPDLSLLNSDLRDSNPRDLNRRGRN